jgi:carboxymethylenebutenolidase
MSRCNFIPVRGRAKQLVAPAARTVCSVSVAPARLKGWLNLQMSYMHVLSGRGAGPAFALFVLLAAALTARAETREPVSVPSPTGGAPMSGILFAPDGGAPAPGVIVLHTARPEFEPADEAYAQRLARNGYVALVLNYRTNTPDSYWSPKITAELLGAARWLRGRPEVGGKALGAVGFSLGVHAMLLAARDPAIVASVVYYGAYDVRKYVARVQGRLPAHVPLPIDKAAEFNGAALLLHGGADDEIPPRSAEEMRDALKAAGKTVELVIYPGATHRFDRGNVEGHDGNTGPTGFTYEENPDAAKDAFARTLAWFGKHLRGASPPSDAAPVARPAAGGDEPVGPTGRTPSQVIAGSDADGDGRVSRAEFKGPPQAFSRLDADGDGFLTRQELIDAWR